MKHASAARKGIIATALACLLVTAASPTAHPQQPNLAARLRNEGIGISIARLERTDGFRFGMLLRCSGTRLIVAPGPDGTWLINSGDSEAVLQRNPETGVLQLIQQTGDVAYILCLARGVVNFLSNLSGCGENNVCLFNSVVALVNAIFSCGSGSGSTSTTTPAASSTTSSTIPGTTTSTAQGATTTVQGATTSMVPGSTTSVITATTIFF